MSTSFMISEQNHLINLNISDTFLTWMIISSTNTVNLFILFQQIQKDN